MDVSMAVLQNTTIDLPYDPAIPLWHLPKGTLVSVSQTFAHLCLLTQWFLRTMFWNQSRCPVTEGWIKKMWYILRVECFSVIKKKIYIVCKKMGITWDNEFCMHTEHERGREARELKGTKKRGEDEKYRREY